MTNKRYGGYAAIASGDLVGTEEFLIKFADGTTNRLTMVEFMKFAMPYFQANFVWDKFTDADIGWETTLHTAGSYATANAGTDSDNSYAADWFLYCGPVAAFTDPSAAAVLEWVPVNAGDPRPAIYKVGASDWFVAPHVREGYGVFPGVLTIRFVINGARTTQSLVVAYSNHSVGAYSDTAWSHSAS